MQQCMALFVNIFMLRLVAEVEDTSNEDVPMFAEQVTPEQVVDAAATLVRFAFSSFRFCL